MLSTAGSDHALLTSKDPACRFFREYTRSVADDLSHSWTSTCMLQVRASNGIAPKLCSHGAENRSIWRRESLHMAQRIVTYGAENRYIWCRESFYMAQRIVTYGVKNRYIWCRAVEKNE